MVIVNQASIFDIFLSLLPIKKIFYKTFKNRWLSFPFLGWIGCCFLLFPIFGFAQDQNALLKTNENSRSRLFSHQIGVDIGQGRLLSPKFFFREVAEAGEELKKGAQSIHLKYSFSLSPETPGNLIFAHTYQGIGIGYQKFDAGSIFGNPFLVYLFQHSRLFGLSRKVSLDYEWNFGVATGWNPYSYPENPINSIIGSKVNAYINLGVYLNWDLSDQWSLIGGVDVTHFSNGNTDYPNAGLNMGGFRMGTVYAFTPKDKKWKEGAPAYFEPQFPKHWSYDLVLFGSWRKKGVDFFGERVVSPYKYTVLGGYFAPFYNFTYRFRAGLSVDALYDGSANVYTEDYIIGTEQPFFKPNETKQMALGTSVRGEYVMPLFAISLGVGTHVLHGGGDLKGTYQSLALKVRTTKNTFLHIGYNLKDFKEPNYLMLGLGYRFNNQTPSLLKQ